jgi:hypothetical protein
LARAEKEGLIASSFSHIGQKKQTEDEVDQAKRERDEIRR